MKKNLYIIVILTSLRLKVLQNGYYLFGHPGLQKQLIHLYFNMPNYILLKILQTLQLW